MTNRHYIPILSFLACMVCIPSCKSIREQDAVAVTPVVPVTVTSPRTGNMAEYSEMMATSAFLVKTAIKSPVTGYIEKCSLTPGDMVITGQVLFQLRTRESAALEQGGTPSMKITGIAVIKAPMNGVVSVLEHPRGDFVQEGDGLSVIVDPASLAFLMEVPYEMNRLIRKGQNFRLNLPDHTTVEAYVRSVLPSMSGASQTQRVVLQPESGSNIPENLTVRVNVMRSFKANAMILPKSCLLNDEVMKHFWVMKLLNDSMAVKVQVEPGIQGTDSAEVISPALGITDRILSGGNYGLADSVRVRIIKHE